MEFAGCLYDAPVRAGEPRDMRVDSKTGVEYPFDLTKEEIQSMEIKGVPIKIEHTALGFERGDEVGQVTDSFVDPKSGYTACKFKLNDTSAGRIIGSLIKSNTVNSLSLGHLYHPGTRKVNATEVSVCFDGAREGTRLYKQVAEYDSIKVKASAMDANTNADAQANEQSGAPAAMANYTDMPLADLLQECTKGSEFEGSNHLFKRVADMATMLQSANDTQEKHRTQISELTSAKDELQNQMTSNEKSNKKKAEECVAVMNALMAEYVPGAHNAIPTSGSDDNATFRDIAYSVPVLASALNTRRALTQVAADARTTARSEQMAELRAVEASLKSRMPAVWDEKPVAEIAVKASGRAHGRDTDDEPSAKRGGAYHMFESLTDGQRNALASLGTFASTGQQNKMNKTMLPDNFKGSGGESMRIP